LFLTTPQSTHFREEKFEGHSPDENHFDWELFYRFKDQRERFWLAHLEADSGFRSLVEGHFARFQDSIDRTVGLLEGTDAPRILDVGLSSEPFDRSLMKRMGAKVVVLDVQPEASQAFDNVFQGNCSFVLDDVITHAANPVHRDAFDLVYSVGLLEHFPDKRKILDAHIALTRPGGLVLIYVPIDTPAVRELSRLAAEWENFGYRELLTPDELRSAVADPRLEVVRSEPVGMFAAVWARKR
jgi:SAM-dependent methyltransferase